VFAVDGFWFEVKPLSNVKADLSPLLNTLHGFGEPFSFILTSQTSAMGRTVKIFFRTPSMELQNQLAHMVRNTIGAEIILDAKPQEKVYGCSVEAEMAKHYSRPLVAEDVEGLVDRIYEAVWHVNGALEVTCQPDQTAKTWIYREMEKTMGKGVRARDIIPFTATEKSVRARVQAAKEDPYRKTLAELMMKKYRSRLFRCTVKVYAETRAEAENILKATPTHLNKLRKFKTTKNVTFPEPFRKPSRHTLRNLCSKISLLTPIAVLYLCWRIGLFSPGQLLTEGLKLTPGSANTLPLFLAFLSLIIPLALLRKRNAIVLSAEELSAIVNIPQAVDRIPLEHGETPVIKKAAKPVKIKETPIETQKLLPKTEK